MGTNGEMGKDMKFTDEQQKVIDTRNKNMLVSAAAGSGKTAVLTERIVDKVCGKKGEEAPENRPSIDKMLIVTFTNAAAREMRDRIGRKFRERLEENPGDPHIRKQIAILHTAQITTIDSFCLYILKNHFEEIGMDPSFTIGTEGEIAQISEEAFEDTLEKAFIEGNEEFLNLVEMYAPDGKFADFQSMVTKLANKVDSTSYPYETLEKFIVDENEDVWNSEFIKYVTDYEKHFFEGARAAYEAIRDETEGTVLTKHNIQACEEISYINNLIDGDFRFRTRSLNTPHDKTKLSYGAALKNFTDEERAFKEEESKKIKEAAKILEKVKEKFHCIKEEDFENAVREGRIVTNSIVRFVISYMKTFEEIKKEKGIISFCDMEHLALKILASKDENGNIVPSETAERYREFFDEVMIDEYQDSNDVQETILGIISKKDANTGNRFMVGDVKQSIYRFRMANPGIFLNKCETYKMNDDSLRDIRINLSNNFRSRREIIDSVNYVFERCMKKDIGGIPYDENERLNLGNTDYPDTGCDYKTELLYFDKQEVDDSLILKDIPRDEIEARMVALKIKELIANRTQVFDKDEGPREIRLSDIAILLRGMSGNKDVIFQRALKEANIDAYVISKSGYYDAWEVQLILSFLSLMDNPRQDMPLLGVLHSFIGGFSDEEIAKIRAHGGKANRRKRLIDSLNIYLNEGSDEAVKTKIRKFTEDLEDLRKKALYMSASDMLREIYERYEVLIMVSSLPGGEQRLANVKLLAETADEYETQGIFCIHDFVKYTENLKARQDMGEANMLDEKANVVRIMTIHKSKGLEFPICFVSNMHTEIKGTSEKVLTDEEIGIGGDTFNLEKRTKGVSPVKRAIEAKENVDSLGEEIRVLYVAMTRAKEKLILTGMLKEDLPGKDDLSFYDIVTAKSFMGLVYPIAKEEPNLFNVKKFNLDELNISDTFNETERMAKRDRLDCIDAKPGIEEYVYPHKITEGMFVKTTVSELKKAAYLEREDGENTLYHEEEVRVPKIISDTETENGGAARGSAYHRVMELMDFEHIYDGDIAANLRAHRQKMTDNLFIYEEDDALVSEDKILKFLDTDFAKRMSEAAKREKLYLEQPFVLSVPANEVNEEFPDTEKVLVQGVIDVYFEEDGKLILMDYKTDRVDTAEELIKRYKTQLDYYSEALSRLEKKPVAEVLIYSFALGEVITV